MQNNNKNFNVMDLIQQIIAGVIVSGLIATFAWFLKSYFSWKKFDKFISTIDFPRRRLARRMNTEAFLKWQDRILKRIYGAEHFTVIFNKEYPVYSIDFERENYSIDEVDSLCKDKNNKLLITYDRKTVNAKGRVTLPDIYDTDIMTQSVETNPELAKKDKALKKSLMGNGWWWKGYKWFTARSMRDGNHIGFILDHIDQEDKKIQKIHLSVGSYKLNLLTSHIMTYELFKAYKKLQKSGTDMDNVNLEELWPLIPFRRYIHETNGNDINKVLFTGKGRYALLSVQCLVMLCTTESGYPEYKTFLLRRSDNTRDVSTKLGCYQFPPSGGFDLYDEEELQDKETIRSNCSLSLALMREYLEEIFNDHSYAKVDKSNNLKGTATIELVNLDKRTKEIRDMLKTPIADNRFKSGTHQAYFTSVGANIDLIDLRLSVNFLLVINDYNYYKNHIKEFSYNEEFGNTKGKMLRDWNSISYILEGERKIVEDSVSVYAQGQKVFEKYISDTIVPTSL